MLRLAYCAYDEATGHYAYYAGSGKPRVQPPPQRPPFLDYREIDVLLPDDAQPTGSGLMPKGIVVQPNQVFCMPPCQKPSSENHAWIFFLWGLRLLFL